MRHIQQFQLLTFYKFVDIPEEEAHRLVQDQWQFTHDIGLKGRVYIGTEWISSTVTGNQGQLWAYRAYLESIPYFRDIPDIDSKANSVAGHEFEKMTVKYRDEIVALWEKVTAEEVAKYRKELSPEEFKRIIDENKLDEYLILDMRNDYEYQLGHFKGAIPAGTVNFREVPKLLERYKEAAQNKKIIWYCTGGIRCEKAAVIMNKAGFEDIYAIEGGVVKYTNTYNDGNWLGNLYTFDGRVSTQIGDEWTHTTIGSCLYSGIPTDNCENCRYAPCNARLIADHKEFVKHGGFCSQECFQNAQKDWLVKNVAWDPFDYKLTVRQAKRAWGDTETQLMQSLQENITKRFGGATFNHAVSQKESAIVMD
jgi:UPF0176 protein